MDSLATRERSAGQRVITALRHPPYIWQAVMNYILVLQWSGNTKADYDGLIAMETCCLLNSLQRTD